MAPGDPPTKDPGHLDDLVTDFGMALIFISHDVGVIARIADRTLVMYGGRQMEQGPTEQVLRRPTAEYTQRLLSALPRRARGSLAGFSSPT